MPVAVHDDINSQYQSCCPRGLALASRILEDTIWRSWPQIEAKAKTFLRLEKSPERFQINDGDFAVFDNLFVL